MLRAPEIAFAQQPVQRHEGHEYQTDGGQMAELREIVDPVGIDHRERSGKLWIGEVVVDHDHLEPEPVRFRDRLVTRSAAIDSYEKRRALRGERAHRFDV